MRKPAPDTRRLRPLAPAGPSDLILPPAWRRLGDAASGELYYSDDPARPGIILVGRAKHAAPRHLLCARVAVRAVAVPGMGGQLASYTLAITPPGAERAIELTATRETILSGVAFEQLAGAVEMQTASPRDLQALLTAVQLLTLAPGVRRQRLVPSLGWHEGYWVLGNGAIGGETIAYEDAPFVASIPRGWQQQLPGAGPDGAPALPARVDAATLRQLLDAFGPDSYAMLALIGALARVALPLDDGGRVPFAVELYGRTGSLKTSFCNWALRLFSGAGYTHDTPTLIADGRAKDTAIGLGEKRAKLRHHGYLDVDLNAGPDDPREWERQQEYRLANLKADGNRARAGMKGKRDGGGEERATPGGLLITTGEHSPYLYSVPHNAESSDARAVTFLLPDPDEDEKRRRRDVSRRLTAEGGGQLDRALVAWVQWLAALGPAEVARRYLAATHTAETYLKVLRERHGYERAHAQTDLQLGEILAGLDCYIAFLRAADAETGTAPAHIRCIAGGAALAAELERRREGLVLDRLAAAVKLRRIYDEHRGGETTDAALARKILDAWRSALARHAAYLNGPDGRAPDAELPAGYRAEHVGWQERGGEWIAGGVNLGQFEKSGLTMLIRPHEAYDLIVKALGAATPGPSQCWAALEREEIIAKQGSHYAQWSRAGGGGRYLRVATHTLLPALAVPEWADAAAGAPADDAATPAPPGAEHPAAAIRGEHGPAVRGPVGYGPGDIVDPHKPRAGPLAPHTGKVPCAVCGADFFAIKDRLAVCPACRPAYAAAFPGEGYAAADGGA